MSVPTAVRAPALAGFQVWELRSGGHLLLSACSTKHDQEDAMGHWADAKPDALLVYRTRQADGSVLEELHLDRTLDAISGPARGRAA